MTVEELRIFINAIANRDQTGNSVTPDEFNTYLARANEDKFRIETGLREVQTPIFFQSNIVSTDALSPFIKVAQIAVAAGNFVLPTNYRHMLSMSHIDSKNRNRIVTALNVDEFDSILGNPVKAPTEQYPYATQHDNVVQVSPDTVSLVKLSYLSKPAVPFWGYTILNDEPIYNPLTSVQLEWKEIYHIDIARIILVYMGVNFRDADLLQYSMNAKNTGS